jgi:phenylacetate-CoA ligase
LTLLDLYYRLPAWARSAAASTRGFYLRSWRYGAESEQLTEEALARERWSRRHWEQWQLEQLDFILNRAVSRVPHYRAYWNETNGDWRRLENWPILEKEPLRRFPQSFVADTCDARKMFHDHTSGTTGTSLSIWLSRATVRGWYALFEARCRRWYGVSRRDRWAMIGGQLVTPVNQRRPPFWVWNAGLNQLYLSSYHLAPEAIPSYLDALGRYRIQFLLGYTSSLYALAVAVLQRGLSVPQMQVVVTNAEPVFDYQRTVISHAFRCPVRESYGMAEIVTAASECERGVLHLWPEAGLTEVLDGDSAHSGELVCTGLFNPDMPLIRYRTGDRGSLAPQGEVCGCGRTLPILRSLEGRNDDVLYTTDGRRIGRLDPVFKAGLPIQEAQIIQEALDRIRVRYVPDAAFGPDAARSLVERLQARMGASMRIELESSAQIPRTANGKFRAVICQLPKDQIRALSEQVH